MTKKEKRIKLLEKLQTVLDKLKELEDLPISENDPIPPDDDPPDPPGGDD